MAALTVPDTGLGTTIAGTGLITTFIKRIGSIEIGNDPLDVTTLATTSTEVKRPGDLRKMSSCEVEFYWMGATVPTGSMMVPTTEPYAGIAVTITYPGAGIYNGTAFVSNVKTPTCAKGEIMTGSYTLTFDGVTPLAFTVA